MYDTHLSLETREATHALCPHQLRIRSREQDSREASKLTTKTGPPSRRPAHPFIRHRTREQDAAATEKVNATCPHENSIRSRKKARLIPQNHYVSTQRRGGRGYVPTSTTTNPLARRMFQMQGGARRIQRERAKTKQRAMRQRDCHSTLTHSRGVGGGEGGGALSFCLGDSTTNARGTSISLFCTQAAKKAIPSFSKCQNTRDRVRSVAVLSCLTSSPTKKRLPLCFRDCLRWTLTLRNVHHSTRPLILFKRPDTTPQFDAQSLQGLFRCKTSRWGGW